MTTTPGVASLTRFQFRSMMTVTGTVRTLAVSFLGIFLLGLVPATAEALSLIRGTPAFLAGPLGNIQVNYLDDAVLLSGYVDATGVVDPAPVPIPTVRIQYDMLNHAGNGTVFEFRVDYEPGTTVIGAGNPSGFFDSAGNPFTYWDGLPYTVLFDAGFGTYNYAGGEWEVEYQIDHVVWRQLGNGFFPDTATGSTNFGFHAPFSLSFAPGTSLGLMPATVFGLDPVGLPGSASGMVLSAVAPPNIEVDHFPESQALVGIQMADGTVEGLRLIGPTTVHVFLDELADWDGDGREQVPTEMVELELHGNSPLLGPVALRLRDPSLPPFRRSTGEIEENVNNTQAVLDVPPFAPVGTADSFFDVFFEVEVAGLILYADVPSRMESTITHKPPGPGTAYDKPPGHIPLLAEDGTPTGLYLTQANHTPQPAPIEVDVFPDSFAVVEIETPVGSEVITLTGPTTVEVDLASLADTDGNSREQVPTEVVQMDLSGDSMFGPVELRIRDVTEPPFQRSVGEIEESSNAQVGRLDLPPFAPSGTADSYFDIFFEVEVLGNLYHNLEPKRMRRLIEYKPPKWGAMYENLESIQLYDENGNVAPIVIGANRHAPDPKEVDFFPDTLGIIEIEAPWGNEIVRLRGPTTVEVDLAAIGDPDGNSREQVPTEIVSMNLTGNSSLGPIEMRVRDATMEPVLRSLGEIEEDANLTPSILDIPPFTPAGAADSFFDVFFEVDVLGQRLHNRSPKRFVGRISHKPPGPHEVYESLGQVELFDQNGEPTGMLIGGSQHIPVPDGDGDGVPFDVDNCPDTFNPQQQDIDGDEIGDACDNCIEIANTDQRDTNGDAIGNACDADITNDCLVNFGDLAALKSAFIPRPYDPDADFDGDGAVNFGDLALMKSTFFSGANPGPGPSGLPNACD